MSRCIRWTIIFHKAFSNNHDSEDNQVKKIFNILADKPETVAKFFIPKIDEDGTVDSQKGNVYFNVKVKPEKIYLTDKRGDKVNLTLGMITETRVKYEKITCLKYFLEQIGAKLD